MHHGCVPSAGATARESLVTLTLLSRAGLESDCDFVEPLLYLRLSLSLCLLSCEPHSLNPSPDVKQLLASLSFFISFPLILLAVFVFLLPLLPSPLPSTDSLLLTLDGKLSSPASQRAIHSSFFASPVTRARPSKPPCVCFEREQSCQG